MISNLVLHVDFVSDIDLIINYPVYFSIVFFFSLITWPPATIKVGSARMAIAVNSLSPGDLYKRQWTGSSLIQVMVPVRCQTITWANASVCVNGPAGTNLSSTFWSMKIHLTVLPSKFHLFCSDLTHPPYIVPHICASESGQHWFK